MDLFLLFLFVRGGLFVNRATVLVLHLCSLEHLVAFSLLACVFVIAWLAVDLRLVVVGVEVARIRTVADIHDEFAWEEQSMAYFGTTPDKKSHDHDVGEKAKDHPVGLTGAFCRVKEKLGLRRIADHRPGILSTSSRRPTGRVKRRPRMLLGNRSEIGMANPLPAATTCFLPHA